MKQFKRQDGPLTQAEFDTFNARRLGVIHSMILIFTLAVVVGVAGRFFGFAPNAALVFWCGAPLVIWGLIQMFKFKCPRCHTTPMTTRASLGGGEVEVGSYVALRPKKCHKCGVLFEPPKPNETQPEQP